jgi:hypothetical protein
MLWLVSGRIQLLPSNFGQQEIQIRIRNATKPAAKESQPIFLNNN